ncbi:TPA: hypothetical protein HA318_06120 [Candidatus Micrarchaeota archaeon]|nr:MAG: hypothetical protein AUJ65_02435 [Candidatus Micrarchaeota archaeon CG1_02_51_15]HII39546.1 hypothetical protein [Candidatus Micrarchaeota archaeon]
MDFVPCDYAVKKLLPAVRAEAAQNLASKGWNQQRIASSLGLSQAAVSKYLGMHRTADKKVRHIAALITGRIIGRKKGIEIRLCAACRGRGLDICEISKK